MRIKKFAPVAQCPREARNIKSSKLYPLIPSYCSMYSDIHIKFAPVAQWIEQRTSKPKVVGSIPTRGTIYV